MQMLSRRRQIALPLALLGLVVGATTLLSRPATAAERRTACVLEAKTNGSVTPEELTAFEQAVNNGLKEQQFDLVSKGERDTIIQGESAQGCYKEECQERIGRLLGAQAVVVYSIKVWRSPSGSAWTLGATYYNIEVGAMGAKTTSECPSCTAAQAAQGLSDLVKKAVFEDAAKPRGQIDITSDPTNASVFIDGVELGVTPYKRTIFAGKHELTVRRTGFRSKNQTINVGEGAKATQMIKLEPGKDPVEVKYVKEFQPRPKWRIGLGAGLIGLGLVGIGIGAYGLAIDGSCAGQLPMGQLVCSKVYNGVPAGATFLGLGIAAAAAGAVLIALPGPRNEAAATAAETNKDKPVEAPAGATSMLPTATSGVGVVYSF